MAAPATPPKALPIMPPEVDNMNFDVPVTKASPASVPDTTFPADSITFAAI